MEAVIVEVLNRFGQVRSRHRLSTFPASIGRSLKSDVILDEADVSAQHARVERTADGGLELVDAGATNGLRQGRTKLTRLALGQSTDVRLASAHLRFISPDGPVAKTTVFRLSRLDRLRFAALGLGLYALSMLYEEWWLKAVRVKTSEVVTTATMVLMVVCVCWVFPWSLASRVAHGRSRAVGHFTAAMFGFFGVTVVDRGCEDLFCVLRAGPGVSEFLSMWAALAVAGWLLFQHLTRVVSWKPRRVMLSALVTVLTAGLLVQISQAAKADKYATSLPLSGSHLPPAFVVGTVSQDAALSDRLGRLREQVDALKRTP